jgi:RNA polymerase sigma-70 factor (ECF subfamily)
MFYDAHAESVLTHLTRRVYDADVALDLTAEIFAQAYSGRRRFRGSTDDEAAGWLYTIVRRQLSRYFRRGTAERKALQRLGIEAPTLDDEQRSAIESLAGLGELQTALRVELERLSGSQRDAIRLRVIEELSYADVATRLGISEHAARARVSRGLRALAAALDRNSMRENLA